MILAGFEKPLAAIIESVHAGIADALLAIRMQSSHVSACYIIGLPAFSGTQTYVRRCPFCQYKWHFF